MNKNETPKRGPGRPAKPREENPSVCDGMAQAAAVWKIPLGAIKLAKASGCKAFEKSRVHREPLLAWIAANPKSLIESTAQTLIAELKRQKTEAEVELLRAKIRREESETIPMAEALAETARFVAIWQEETKAQTEPEAYRAICIRAKQRCGEFNP